MYIKLGLDSDHNVWRIYHSTKARAAAIRYFLRKDPTLNYVVGWKNVNGWGLEVTRADWVKPGSRYINL